MAWAARTLPARPPVPVLAGLLLDADGGVPVALVGFDYEVSARVEVAADVAEPGSLVRSAAGRHRAQPARPPGRGDHRRRQGGGHLWLVPVHPADAARRGLPGAARDAHRRPGSLRGDLFAAAVAQVAVAAGRDDTLPVLTGVRVEIEGETVTLAATDRYRLAVRELPWRPEHRGSSAVALVPARTLADTAKAPRPPTRSPLRWPAAGGDGLIGFEGGGRRTTSRLLDGEFPKYKSLLPPRPAAWPRSRPRRSSRRSSGSRWSPSATPRSGCRSPDGEVTLEAGAGEDAQASESLDASMTGDDISIAFNPTYLLDGLGALDAPHVRSRSPPRPSRRSSSGSIGDPTPARLPRPACRCLPADAGRGVGSRASSGKGRTHADRTRRARPHGRQHARAAAPRRPHRGRLRPQPRGQRRRRPSRSWSPRSPRPGSSG